jgi:excisionase family DNA binding protein
MTNNPFETIDKRLANIESLLFGMKQGSVSTPKKDPETLMTIQEAAEFLRLTVPTIYSKVSREKDFPHLKKGKRLYFLREALLEYAKGNTKAIFNIK